MRLKFASETVQAYVTCPAAAEARDNPARTNLTSATHTSPLESLYFW